jgi:hypothetical protein
VWEKKGINLHKRREEIKSWLLSSSVITAITSSSRLPPL